MKNNNFMQKRDRETTENYSIFLLNQKKDYGPKNEK